MQSTKHQFKPAKLLLSFVERRRGDILVDVAKKAGARGGTVLMGRTISDNRFLRALSLADISEDIVFNVMGDEAEAVMAAIVEAASQKHKKFEGLALLLDVGAMFLKQTAPEGNSSKAIAPELKNQEKIMESGCKLITVIVNHGYADDIMALARGAGAGGGTILLAHGTGTAEDVRFFGISLVPEKDMLLIVAKNDNVDQIIEAIYTNEQLQTPGGGIVYTMNVEKFMVLGKPSTVKG
ncbi:MAG: P-II family nitrogen regulator [Candidatus Adiutrix sp.]